MLSCIALLVYACIALLHALGGPVSGTLPDQISGARPESDAVTTTLSDLIPHQYTTPHGTSASFRGSDGAGGCGPLLGLN